ncbi:MAG: ABC transporter ATPase [Bacteroidia bacterium]
MEDFLSRLGDTDRVWVYQAERFLSEQETAIVRQSGLNFTNAWAAHGKKLRAGVEVLHNLLVVVHVDEEQAKASGCSIDASVHWITKLGKDLGINFLGRTNVAYFDAEEYLKVANLNEFEELINQAEIDENTRVFNNMAFSGKDVKHAWLLPVKESWHARYLKVQEIK